VVYITARERSDYPDHFWFQFAGDTYLKVGNQRYTITSADGIELNKHLHTKGGRLDMAFHFPPLPKAARNQLESQLDHSVVTSLNAKDYFKSLEQEEQKTIENKKRGPKK
jgi:hypothetical protein